MSILTIPKHWRFDWPLLMGHLKKGPVGHLLYTSSGHLVTDCDPPVPAACCIDGTPKIGAFVPYSVDVPNTGACCVKAYGTFILDKINNCVYSKTIEYTPSYCDDTPDCEDSGYQFFVTKYTVQVELGVSSVVQVITSVTFDQTITSRCPEGGFPPVVIAAGLVHQRVYRRNCGTGIATLWSVAGAGWFCAPTTVTIA